MKQLTLDITTPPVPSFDNFVAGRNREALAHVRAAVSGAGERFIYVWGDAGCGRTHLLKAATGAATGAAYVACDTDSCFDGDATLLAVDDVGRMGAGAQVALFNRYNALREQGGCLIASGDVPPVQLALRVDLLTRLGWGLVLQLYPLTDDEKSQALTQRARARGFDLTREVCAYLLAHTARGIGPLFGTLDALDRFSLETKRPVTVPLLRELLSK